MLLEMENDSLIIREIIHKWNFLGTIDGKIWKNDLVGFKHEWFVVHFIYGMSSETHWRTHSIIFQDGEIAPPPTRYVEMESRIILTGEFGDITVTITWPGKQRKCFWKWQ